MTQMLKNFPYAGAGENLFLNEDLSDLTILVRDTKQNQWRFPVHSLVLSSQSIVFRRMLENDFSEKATGCIEIEDIKPKIMESFLGYIYRGRVHLENWLDALELMHASHKYQVEPLIQYCVKFLESVIGISNVCYIYNDSFMYSLSTLKEKCLKIIVDAAFVLLRSKAFDILLKDAVMDIIKNPELNIDTELTVFEALLRWAPMQCCRIGIPVTEANILHELTPFLNYVCFDDMSDTEKSALPGAVLSLVKPNNRNRISHCVPESLLSYSHSFNFCPDQEFMEGIGPTLTCMRFSVGISQYMIGLKFMVLTTDFPSHLSLTMGKESGGPVQNLFAVNLSSASWKDGLQMNERKLYETQILLRTPCLLEPRALYKLHIADRTYNAYCPKTKLLENLVRTETGHVTISLHSGCVWGVMGLIFI